MKYQDADLDILPNYYKIQDQYTYVRFILYHIDILGNIYLVK